MFTCVGVRDDVCPCSGNEEECACRTLDVAGAGVDVLTCLDCGSKCERTCAECGCTTSQACEGGCSWVDESLCSACA